MTLEDCWSVVVYTPRIALAGTYAGLLATRPAGAELQAGSGAPAARQRRLLDFGEDGHLRRSDRAGSAGRDGGHEFAAQTAHRRRKSNALAMATVVRGVVGGRKQARCGGDEKHP
jgi:hypothetical protein